MQIGVHDDDRCSGSCVHSGCDRDLMTEIARQSDIAVAWIIPNKGLQDDGAAIRAAVINKDRFGWSVELLHQHSYAPQQNRKDCRLVEDWHDDAVANAWRIVRHGNFRSRALTSLGGELRLWLVNETLPMSEYDTVFARHERFDRSALAKARRPGIANLTRAVLRRLFAYAIDLKVCRMLYTGQRVGDAVRMRRSDIRKGAIHVIQGKTGEELYIELHPALERAMKAGPSNGVYLIGDRAGRPITRGGLSALVRAAIKAAGLPGECVAHGLRKAALRRLVEHGSTTKQIQAVSGHHALPEIER